MNRGVSHLVSGDANGVTDPFDFLIVGQGLAGTALAWQLRWRGFRVLVFDRGSAITSSRISSRQGCARRRAQFASEMENGCSRKFSGR